MSDRYSIEEIKQKFHNYTKIQNSSINEDEFNFFCNVLRTLPKEIIDELKNEAMFVLLSAQPCAVNPACMVPLDDEEIKSKRAIIILTPIVFGFYWDRNINEDKMRWFILHEIAHFHLGPKPYKNADDHQKKEDEANNLVQKWIDDWQSEFGKEN